MKKNDIGKIGENAVADLLKKKKYKITATNYRSPFGEIDIIAENKDSILFVEVKTRTQEMFGRGREAVGYSKQAKIIKTAQFYMSEHDTGDKNCMFDVAEVFFDGIKCRVEYLSGAFQE